MTLELPHTTMTKTMYRATPSTTSSSISKKKHNNAINNKNSNSNNNHHKRKSLSLYEKGQIVIEAYSSINNIKPTARKYNIQPHQIREWKLLNVQKLFDSTIMTTTSANNVINSATVVGHDTTRIMKQDLVQQLHQEVTSSTIEKFEIQKHQQQPLLQQGQYKTATAATTTTTTIDTSSDHNMENINTTNTTLKHNMIGIKELQMVCLQHCKSISKSFHRNQLDPSDLETIHTLQRYIINHHHHCSSSNKITMKLLIHHLQSIDPIKYGNISYPILKQKIIRILKQWNGHTGIQSSSIQHQHQSIKKKIRGS